jgi:hypothetical protein
MSNIKKNESKERIQCFRLTYPMLKNGTHRYTSLEIKKLHCITERHLSFYHNRFLL